MLQKINLDRQYHQNYNHHNHDMHEMQLWNDKDPVLML